MLSKLSPAHQNTKEREARRPYRELNTSLPSTTLIMRGDVLRKELHKDKSNGFKYSQFT